MRVKKGIYTRRCSRCDELFESESFYSKICDFCKKKRGGTRDKHIQNRIERRSKRIEDEPKAKNSGKN
ncbi:MAG: hypothetical protein ACOC56_03265 [Atribacterota bacterium]